MSNRITAILYFFGGLAFACAIGAARFGFPELYGMAGLSGCVAALIVFVKKG
ncbi:MAG: hypothetical protein HRU12_16985 [Phaeodactylibacter sp.]|nr:hypothetical protein [Phaeodactylibacter sp.]